MTLADFWFYLSIILVVAVVAAEVYSWKCTSRKRGENNKQ